MVKSQGMRKVAVSGTSDISTKTINIPANASDPFDNTASVTCKPLGSTFSVSDTSFWSTNLFQPKVEIIKSGPTTANYGDEITYTFTIKNLSSNDSPNLMLASISDDILSDLKAAALAASCDNLVYNGTCTFDVKYTIPVQGSGTTETKITNTVKVLYHPDGFPNNVTASDYHTVRVLPHSLITNSALCTVTNNTWRLLFTPDVNQTNGYKLNASNPGQVFYNMFYNGTGGEDVVVTLPYPFVTQGAVPIHVYSNVDVITTNGTTCLVPTGELANQTDQVTLTSYVPQKMGTTTTVTIHVPAGVTFAYLNIHLDYGLKKTTGYAKGGPSGNDAVLKNNTAVVVIADLQSYAFSDTTDGTVIAKTTNAFKKNPGIGGQGHTADGDAKPNTKVLIYQGTKLMSTVYTDEDGWYMWSYKWTGKAATFTVKMPAYNLSQSVTLKANGYLQVDFEVP